MLSPAIHRLTLSAALAVIALGLPGCYNGEKLVEQVRKRAIRTRMDEVSLGSFRVTLPPSAETGDMTELDLEVYGEALRYRTSKLKRELKEKSFLIGDRTLRTLRQIQPEDLLDPDLAEIRQRLLEAINGVLDDQSIEAIGFNEVRLMRH
ncbi:flagellar basal body-associated FliL family protein [Botrimarina hoheduenensis]|uniref:Flagellar protein FliL n=1 Tax=Botrimarina hoheduenensis TaxID=2528000 RepID=A0A5C5W788_9BACT|nr:flagellar basal body-associated FliL family protein [Botrimarina hoheduenensis]TWT46550.1 Flagellar basal body-associated protein FliL [Botrimarina hoheduenensis]